jgi:hypothetical protein
MKFRYYYILLLQLTLPLIITIGQKGGDAPLTLFDVYVFIALQLWMVSFALVYILKKD